MLPSMEEKLVSLQEAVFFTCDLRIDLNLDAYYLWYGGVIEYL